VAILEDHQSVIDGYLYRLADAADIEVAGSAHYGQDLLPLLEAHQPDLLIMDLTVPISEEDGNHFPVLTVLPQIKAKYPDLLVLVISMHAQPTMVRAVARAGVDGYVLKDDTELIRSLSDVIRQVVDGERVFSSGVVSAVLPGEPGPLTPRQIEVLAYLAAEPDIALARLAQELHVAYSTVRNTVSAIYARLGVGSRAAAIAEARKRGLLPPR
jgi:DNA-binding NarL/FixJ family response regulator